MVKLAYLVSAVMFILGLKKMGRPKTAVNGNLLAAVAMALAVFVTFRDVFANVSAFNMFLIVVALAAGGYIGAQLAQKIEMTAMPQLVALFNGFGGIASVLVAGSAIFRITNETTTDELVATALSGIIGAVTFTGSLVAFGKLQELEMFRKPLAIENGQMINLGLAAFALLLTLFVAGGSVFSFWLVVLVAGALGVLLVGPIGGADMPVVIALLNSYSGIAAAATGFVVDNNVLIIAGSLVGASGIILTQIMCKAMNRSLTNVLFGVMDGGSGGAGADVDEVYANVRQTSADDVAMILETAQRVVVVPGYGMAVAQAQHAVRDMANMLTANGTNVEYAIHPVAGRMPGHMNVLLAEADVPYDKLLEMDTINPTMETVDVAIVIGANDVVNPVAKTDPQSPIAGMPIIDVDKARTVVVIKRSLSPGFAKIPNPLFAADNTLMLFGDGKKAVLDIVAAIKENA